MRTRSSISSPDGAFGDQRGALVTAEPQQLAEHVVVIVSDFRRGGPHRAGRAREIERHACYLGSRAVG